MAAWYYSCSVPFFTFVFRDEIDKLSLVMDVWNYRNCATTPSVCSQSINIGMVEFSTFAKHFVQTTIQYPCEQFGTS